MKAALVITLLPFLAACDLMDRMENKSPGKDYIERLSVLEAGMARITPTTLPQPFTVAAITTPAQQPACIPVFRVTTCEDN
jgi:hypothetical protein